jgi:hypothetical protein
MHKGIAAAMITGSLLTGGAIGTAFFGPSIAGAQSSSSDSSSSSSGSSSSSDTAPALPDRPGPRGPHGHGPHADLSVAASTIGISEDDLKAALEAGQSIADVATAHSVDPQTVIDALVADAKAKLADAVTNGELTQEQADARSADVEQHVTDLVNHAGLGGPGGRGGPGCPDMDGSGPPADSGSSSGSSSSSGATSSGTSLET